MNTLTIKPVKTLSGCVSIPGDKSISHRAAILSSLAQGTTKIYNFLTAADCLSTVECLKKMGVSIEGPVNNTLVVHGQGPAGIKEPLDVLNAGNSGTSMRLLTGVLASFPFYSVITGDRSLRERPMERVLYPLQKMGAEIAGRKGSTRAPLAITGKKLSGIQYVSTVASAQVKTAVLLAGLQAYGKTTFTEPALSRDHTEKMLEHFGIPVTKSGLTVSVRGPCTLKAGGDFTVPGDISSAAFFIIAACIIPASDITICGVGVNPTRAGIIDVLTKMGANISIQNERIECGESVADIRVLYAPLQGTSIGGDIIPRLIDEIPILSVAAAAAQGETVITGAEELKYKETDRLKAVAEELRKMGVNIKELPDGLVIEGNTKFNGACCHSRGDHRMAMALSIAGLAAAGETTVNDADCVDISFPQFGDVLNSLVVE